MYEKKTRRIVSITTFVEDQAGRMTLESTGGDVWKYTPRALPTALNIRVEDKSTGKPMRLVRPVTILADDVKEDGSENFSFDDGEVIVLQYK